MSDKTVSAFSPWPTISTLTMSSWPSPKSASQNGFINTNTNWGSKDTFSPWNSDSNDNISPMLVSSSDSWTGGEAKKKDSWNFEVDDNERWTRYPKENYSPRYTSSSEPSPTLNTGASFAFESAPALSPSLNMNNVDRLAAQLLTISEEEDLGNTTVAPVSRISPVGGGYTPSPELSLPEGCRDESLGDSSSDPEGDILPNSRFKTDLCRNFKEKGHCLYGKQCQFAHGNEEMRSIGQHNKYKTKRCQKYWINGYCVYGPRCNFLHYEDPSLVMPKHSQGGQASNQRRMVVVEGIRKGSTGEFSGDSNCTTPSCSPPKVKVKLPTTPLPLEILHRPSFGSGRLAAYTRGGETFWLDTWTQTFV